MFCNLPFSFHECSVIVRRYSSLLIRSPFASSKLSNSVCKIAHGSQHGSIEADVTADPAPQRPWYVAVLEKKQTPHFSIFARQQSDMWEHKEVAQFWFNFEGQHYRSPEHGRCNTKMIRFAGLEVWSIQYVDPEQELHSIAFVTLPLPTTILDVPWNHCGQTQAWKRDKTIHVPVDFLGYIPRRRYKLHLKFCW